MREFSGYMCGVNLGGWMEAYSEEGWKPIYDCKFDPNSIGERDLEQIAKAGFDHVRLPFEFDLVFDPVKPCSFNQGIKVIDKLIDSCKKYHLNLILDMHTCPGYSFHNWENGIFNPFLELTYYQEWFYGLWKLMAQRYLKERDNIVFELLNEFVEEPAERWNLIAEKAVEAIRSIDSTRKILIGGIKYNTIYGLNSLKVHDEDPNIVYNIHWYIPGLYTCQKAWPLENVAYGKNVEYPGMIEDLDEFLKEHPEFAEHNRKYVGRCIDKELLKEEFAPVEEFIKNHPNAILYCGEFGVYKAASKESKRKWFKDMVDIFWEHGMGHNVWTYTDGKSESFALYNFETRKPHDEELIKIVTYRPDSI